MSDMDKQDLEYRMACTEVLEVLKYVPKSQVDKIPKNIIISMQRLKRYDYKFRFDKTKTVNEQNISKAAKNILSGFYRDYWVNDSIRRMMLAKEKFDQKNKEAV
jgi:glutaredoxin-related protein